MAEKVQTEYVIVSGPWGGDDWTEIDRITASGAPAAQRRAYEKHGNEGKFRLVAVAARSWVPVYIEPQTKVQLSFNTEPTAEATAGDTHEHRSTTPPGEQLA